MTTQIKDRDRMVPQGSIVEPQSAPPKSILLHVQDDASLECRIECALSLARASRAHLACLHVTPIQAYVAFDSFGGVFVMDDVMKALEERENRIRQRVEKALRTEDVSWDYEQVTGDTAGSLTRHAAFADLVVVGRDPHRDDFTAPATGLIGDLLHRARSPLFVPGDTGKPVDPAGIAMIAWDGSYEAANAVRSSVGLLQLASEVRIVKVAEGEDKDFPPTKVLRYLSRHGVNAELVIEQPPSDAGDDDVVAAALVAHARASGAAYLVMGGYSHSRVRQYIFGGVTSALLKGCPVPLIMAH